MIRLSASKIECFQKCSWVYYVNYILKIRDGGNDGSKRGTCSHSVFEVLLKPKRRKYVEMILAAKDINIIPSLRRYIERQARKEGLINEHDNKGNNNLDLINKMIVFGLSCDFFADSEKIESPEFEFEYKHVENGKEVYWVTGFIDRLIKLNDSGRYRVEDYKSSSQRYVGEEGATQSSIYALYLYRIKKAMSVVRFIFLRDELNPYLEKEYTEEELLGFEQYLIQLTKYLDKFTMEKAMSNFAADKGWPAKDAGFSGQLMCGYAKYLGHVKEKTGQPYYACAMKFARKYWGVYSAEGDYLYGSFEEPSLQSGQIKVELEYKGCPYWNPKNYTK